jgi:hypothetical protein
MSVIMLMSVMVMLMSVIMLMSQIASLKYAILTMSVAHAHRRQWASNPYTKTLCGGDMEVASGVVSSPTVWCLAFLYSQCFVFPESLVYGVTHTNTTTAALNTMLLLSP